MLLRGGKLLSVGAVFVARGGSTIREATGKGAFVKSLFVFGCSFVFDSSSVVGSFHFVEFFLVVSRPGCRQWLSWLLY